MCDACLEMELYFAYLSEVEAKKQLEQQKAQPWQCEVTIIPQGDEKAAAPSGKPAATPDVKSGFACDEPE